MYKGLGGNQNILSNWKGDVFTNATLPSGSDLYLGRLPWYNSDEKRFQHFDGTAIQTIVTKEDLTKIGNYQGVFDASAGVPDTTLDGSSIVKGDFWRVGTAGTISGIGGDDVLEIGDIVFANADGASNASDFDAVQANLNLPTNLAQVEEITLDLTADTATACMGSFTNVYHVQCFDSSDAEIGLEIEGPTTARTVKSSDALTGVKLVLTGN